MYTYFDILYSVVRFMDPLEYDNVNPDPSPDYIIQ